MFKIKLAENLSHQIGVGNSSFPVIHLHLWKTDISKLNIQHYRNTSIYFIIN